VEGFVDYFFSGYNITEAKAIVKESPGSEGLVSVVYPTPTLLRYVIIVSGTATIIALSYAIAIRSNRYMKL